MIKQRMASAKFIESSFFKEHSNFIYIILIYKFNEQTF